jgi:hypothetical protein
MNLNCLLVCFALVLMSAAKDSRSSQSQKPIARWRLEEQPLLSIGVAHGRQEEELHRVAGVAELNDGRLVVANSGTSELRYFDSAGQFLFAAGGEGSGPGEFRDLKWIRPLSSDSVVAWDPESRRVTLFDRDGVLSRSFSLSYLHGRGGHPNVVDLLNDATFLVVLEPPIRVGGVEVVRDTIRLVRVDRQGVLIGSIGKFAGKTNTVISSEGVVDVMSLPFGPDLHIAASHAGFFVGTGETNEIRYLLNDGSSGSFVTTDVSATRLTGGEIAEFRRDYVTRMTRYGVPRQRAQRLAEDVPFPDKKPAYGPLRVDAEGNLWVAQYIARADEFRHFGRETIEWQVFNAAGETIAIAETPCGFTPYRIASNYVVGKWTDAMDVEYVGKYRLLKG